MTESMVEKVARAMYASDAKFSDAAGMGFRPDWDADNPRHAYYFNMARAAIEAMKEPTTQMLFEGVVAQDSEDLAVQGIYTAMIQAALTEGTGE